MLSLKDFIKKSLENPSFTVVRNSDEQAVDVNQDASGENGNEEAEK
ncbi:hypothetical protein ACI513_03380 [Chryseobacterium sp. M5]